MLDFISNFIIITWSQNKIINFSKNYLLNIRLLSLRVQKYPVPHILLIRITPINIQSDIFLKQGYLYIKISFLHSRILRTWYFLYWLPSCWVPLCFCSSHLLSKMAKGLAHRLNSTKLWIFLIVMVKVVYPLTIVW